MRARTWTAASLAIVVLLAVAASDGWTQPPGAVGKPAAVVNGETISLAEVDAVLKSGKTPPIVPVSTSRQRQDRFEALAMLIDNLLLQQYLRKNAPPADAGEIARHIAELQAALQKDNKKLADYLNENGMTAAQLRTQVTNALQWRDYVKIHVSDADIEKYYQANKDFFDGVQVRASHILIRVPLTGSDADVEAARARLQAIRQEIEAGKITFADAAMKYSQCPSAPAGGDLGYFPRKFFIDEEFAKAAFTPQLKLGEMIGLVRTEMGWHLIKLTDRKAGTPSEFAKLKENVRDVLLTELRINLVAQQRKQARIEINLP
jgi:peptidyl-prolyl cis-trans isomerase C